MKQEVAFTRSDFHLKELFIIFLNNQYRKYPPNDMLLLHKPVFMFLACSWLCLVTRTWASQQEEDLYYKLMKSYNSLIRPVKNSSQTLTVLLGLSISQLIDVDEKNQIMKSSLWLKQKWKDYQLTWNPDDYDGITVLHVPVDSIWTPDVVLYNNADGAFDATMKTMALIYSDGTVSWIPPVVYKSSCAIDIQHFPIDEQRCKLKLGSWTYDGAFIDLEPMSNQVDQESFWENGEWEIVETPIRKHQIKYPCCKEVYVDITFTLILHRKSLFYIVTLIIPCVFINLLTICVFLVPSDACEKITLCISILLALIVFLLLITEIIPPTSQTIPLIGKYLLFTMVLESLSIAVTVFVINVHYRKSNTYDMPPWIRKVFIETLPSWLHVERPEKGEKYHREDEIVKAQQKKKTVKKKRKDDTEKNRPNNLSQDKCSPAKRLATISTGLITAQQSARRDMYDYLYGNSHLSHHIKGSLKLNGLPPSLREEIEWREQQLHSLQQTNRTSESSDGKDSVESDEEVREVAESINYIVEQLKEEGQIEEVSGDWKYVAMVIDRLFLYIYLLACITGTISIMLSSPLLYEPKDKHSNFHPETSNAVN